MTIRMTKFVLCSLLLTSGGMASFLGYVYYQEVSEYQKSMWTKFRNVINSQARMSDRRSNQIDKQHREVITALRQAGFTGFGFDKQNTNCLKGSP